MPDSDTHDPELILLVDDDGNVRNLLRGLLEIEGYLVEEASNGTKGWEKYERRRPDAVLIDCMMPGIDGFEFCTHIHELPREAQVPVMVITALNDAKSVDRAFEAGAIDYITKPIHWPIVRQRLRRVLLAERAQKQLEAKHNLLRTLIDNMPDHIYVKDNDGRFVDANLGTAAGFGLSRLEDLIGKSDFDFHPQERAAQFYADERAVRLGQPLVNHEELVIDGQTGREQWLLTTKVALHDSQGNVTGLVGIGRDITERKKRITESRRAAEALENERNLLRTLIDNLPDYIFTKDREGRYVISNLAHTRAAKMDSSAALTGKTAFEVFSSDLATQFDADDMTIMDTGSAMINVERETVDSDGNPQAVLTTKVPLRDSAGNVIGLVGISRDISERKRIEAAELEQRVLAEALRNSAEALIGSVMPNEVLRRILEIVGRVVPHDWSEILLIEGYHARAVYSRGYTPDEDSNLRAERFALDTPTLQWMLTKNSPVFIADTRANQNWIEVIPRVRSFAAAPIRAHGQIIGFLNLTSAQPGFFNEHHASRLQAFADQAAIAVENSQLYDQLQRHTIELEQRISERTLELQRAKDHVEAILNNTSDAILVTKADGTIDQANPSFSSQFGYLPEEVIGGSLLALIAPEDAERLMSVLALTVAEGLPQRIQVQVQRKDDATFDADIGLSLIVRHEGTFAAVGTPQVVCSVRNITESKRIERELQELNQLKTAFLSTAAHELRTPLASIVGFSELLLAREMDASRTKHYVQIINEQGHHLATIIDALLDISRLEARQSMALEVEPTNLPELVTKTLSYFAEFLPKYQFVVEGLTECPPIVADPLRLGQVFQNLLSNAIKYSPNGGAITIHGQVTPGFIQMSIRDQGMGMTASQQVHLFERFYRADASNTTISGTGLGLSICKLIVELHGGQIWVESEFGAGTTIYFTLPIKSDATKDDA